MQLIPFCIGYNSSDLFQSIEDSQTQKNVNLLLNTVGDTKQGNNKFSLNSGNNLEPVSNGAPVVV